MYHATRLILILSTLTGGVIYRNACAATTAKLSVSAIVETRCSIKVISGTGKQGSSVQSDCSDPTAPAVSVWQAAQPSASGSASAASSATTDASSNVGIGNADITVTY